MWAITAQMVQQKKKYYFYYKEEEWKRKRKKKRKKIIIMLSRVGNILNNFTRTTILAMPLYAFQCSQASNRTAFSICNTEQATKEPLKIDWNHSRAIRHTDKSALRNTHRFVEVKGRILRREWHSLGTCWHPCSPDDTSADYWSIL